MKRLAYSPEALADLRDIALYIAEDNPDRAMSFVAELERKAALAAMRLTEGSAASIAGKRGPSATLRSPPLWGRWVATQRGVLTPHSPAARTPRCSASPPAAAGRCRRG
ncbi:type II toxin-antitoxin system RelE/ParE family toxin [Jiella sonneratiae]|uniref:Type II toxin-antitoxin system RelE/ParE family toxin n=1 Tax=Jiella sonneratiae TaxID=2816856 RepID=A0ABS3J959_9HYPH|nr:type II toxin-antitoxin system RelE/ParE family toxin [Jiella sonneratiae]